MSSLTVPIPPDLSPPWRAGNTDLGTVPGPEHRNPGRDTDREAVNRLFRLIYDVVAELAPIYR
jgi:hypothetical protein